MHPATRVADDRPKLSGQAHALEERVEFIMGWLVISRDPGHVRVPPGMMGKEPLAAAAPHLLTAALLGHVEAGVAGAEVGALE